MADPGAVAAEHNVRLCSLDEFRDLHALILAVPHSAFDGLDGGSVSGMLAPSGIFVDVKSRLAPEAMREDISYWSL
jgi:UDP-N-acetyl-D-galactosamine dehydrogenase